MNQMQPQATPIPIHDITGPVFLFSFSTWMVILAGVALLFLLGLVVWLMRRKSSARQLTAKERALAALSVLHKEGATDSYVFGIKVSDALRSYLHEQYHLSVMNRTSLEFLESLRNNPLFNANEKAALAEFLESVDLLKYARQEASPDQVRSLLEIAERVVKGESEKEKVS